MATPLYVLTVYAPRSEDPTETTVLRPVAGAPHTDQFIIANKQGVSGAKPYLQSPKGRTGAIDAATRKLSTGNLTVDCGDVRVTPGGDNAVRWFMSFLGDAAGQTRMKGCRFTLQRSLDGTVGSLTPYFAGRVRDTNLSGTQTFTLNLKDAGDQLSRMIFLGAPDPSVTYAAMASLLPVGLPIQFGNIPPVAPLKATLDGGGILTFDLAANGSRGLITKTCNDFAADDASRLVFVQIVGGASGTLHWPSRNIRPVVGYQEATSQATHYHYSYIYLERLAGDMAYPTGTVDVLVSISTGQQPTSALPLLVGDVHPVQFLADIADGKFSLPPGQTTLAPLVTRDSSPGGPWAPLLADPSFKKFRGSFDKPSKANDFIEQSLLIEYGLAYVLDASNNLVPIDVRRTNTRVPVGTLTNADAVAGGALNWSDLRDGAITAVEWHYALDRVVLASDLASMTDAYPDLPPTMLATSDSSLLDVNDLTTLGDGIQNIPKFLVTGSRISFDADGEMEIDAQGQGRVDTLTKDILAAIDEYLAPFQSGKMSFKIPYPIDGPAGDIRAGLFVDVEHEKLPNPGTNRRGGTRLGFCCGAVEQGATLTLEFLDYGNATPADTPTINSCAQASDDVNAIDVDVTANAAGDEVAIWAAVTDPSVSARPATANAAWTRVGAPIGSATERCRPFPQGMRVWFRARSQAIGVRVNAPSDWVYPTTPYVDLAGPSAPSGLSVSNVVANRVDLTWTLGDPALVEDVFVTAGTLPGTWTSAMKVRTLPPGTTQFRLTKLATNTQYTAGVRTRDASGGPSTVAYATFTTGLTQGVAPRPAAIDVLTRPGI